MIKKIGLISIVLVLASFVSPAQTIYEYKRDDADVLFFNKNLSQYIPQIIREYERGKAIHTGIWSIDTVGKSAIQPPMMMVSDWADDGNGGVSSIPKNLISIEMAPINFSYFVAPSTERYHHLFRHEYTHTVMTDKTAAPDRFWRGVLGGKFSVDSSQPFSALWSFLGAPRWYSPRWYHEGIACFMETWLSGGVGRALGGYDEMYFRSVVDAGEDLYSVVGLETEGTTSDFQVGTNSYLYGTRFVNYLEYKYGLDKLIDFYNRTEDSEALFNHQFEKVYGTDLREEWDNWRDFEVQHQKEQIASIEKYPITETEQLSDKSLGSMSPMVVDTKNNVAYMAVNYPGDFAHIEKIDLTTNKRDKLKNVDGAMLYQTSYLALDTIHQRLIWTILNGTYRGLCVYDLEKGKTIKQLFLQRVSCLVYDNVNDCLYCVFTNEGKQYLMRYDSDIDEKDILYSFPFGVSVFDLDVSHNGKYISAVISGDNGEQTLVRFDIDGLNNADLRYETLYTAEDFNLGQFRFAPGDTTMVGSSYYTGISNIWSLDLNTKELSLLSNTRIGLFSPVVLADGTILAAEFDRNGMRPVSFEPKVLEDANTVSMLGQLAYEAHPQELESLSISKVQAKEVSFGEVYDSIKVYHPISRLKFTGAFPTISGFRDKLSWNSVTPVLAYRFTFSDPLGLNSLKIDLGISPWSHNDPINQYHAKVDWKLWNWSFKAAFNPTSFYDLVGPIQSSRKGYQVGVGYAKSSTNYYYYGTRSYGFNIDAFGMMDALPLYQNVATQDIKSFGTASAYYQFNKTRTTLGGVTPESGYKYSINAMSYYAGGKFYPSVEGQFDVGFRIPLVRNTCFWLRSAVGQNFSDSNSIFGNSYFGGFGNNWVDYREANRYRTTSTFAGAQIDEIQAHSYAKLMAELSLKPLRFNDFGFINLYPTYTQLNLFSSCLATDPWGGSKIGVDRNHYYNIGAQLNTEVVLFKFLKTTWSLGYARVLYPDGTTGGDWLLSLKLL